MDGMAYGTSKSGVESLLDELKAELITKVSEQAADISTIKNACENNWQGTSRERFITNLEHDVTVLQDGLNQLYGALGTEINAVSSAIMDFDQNLIDEG